MNTKLKEAISKGRTIKENKKREEKAKIEAARSEHQKYIDSMLPKARKWIQTVLYDKIAEIEASNAAYKSVYLGSNDVDGIPAEAIYEAAKKIKGLCPEAKCYPSYTGDIDYPVYGDPVYEIKWSSADENEK